MAGDRHRIRGENSRIDPEARGSDGSDMGKGFMGHGFVDSQGVIKIKKESSECHKPDSLPLMNDVNEKKDRQQGRFTLHNLYGLHAMVCLP